MAEDRQIKEKSRQVDFNRFNISGTVTRIYPLQKRSERFMKQEFSIRFTDINPFNNRVAERNIKFTLINEDIRLLENVREDDQVEVLFYVDGRDYTKDGVTNNFTSLAAIGLVNLDNMDGLREDKKKEEDPRDIFNKAIDSAFSSDDNLDIFSKKQEKEEVEKDDDYKVIKPAKEKELNETEKEALEDMDKEIKKDSPDKALDEFDDLPF